MRIKQLIHAAVGQYFVSTYYFFSSWHTIRFFFPWAVIKPSSPVFNITPVNLEELLLQIHLRPKKNEIESIFLSRSNSKNRKRVTDESGKKCTGLSWLLRAMLLRAVLEPMREKNKHKTKGNTHLPKEIDRRKNRYKLTSSSTCLILFCW